MVSVERQRDDNEAVNHFLGSHGNKLEPQALKLARCYRIDLHELLSRTMVTVWEKWSSEFRALPHNECYQRTLRIMSNHARNLSKSARRDEVKCDLLPGDELERATREITKYQDPVAVEALFNDERFAIYAAISQLSGRCRDVMTLVALGLENSDIRQELGMTVTNLTSTKERARRLLQLILGLADEGEGGEPR